jgi:putative membrane-bound dehydrogenase-like protein
MRFCAVLTINAVLCAAWTHAQVNGPVPPEDSTSLIQTAPGVRVELIAAEPLVQDPVAVAWDEHGKFYAVENVGYPSTEGQGRVALLRDEDGDGRYDARTTFVDGLDFPNGVMPWRGGILVTCAPDVIHFKDTDGDGVADTRDVILTGFSLGGSTQLRVSHPTLGLDNWLYFTNGLSGGKVHAPGRPDMEPLEMGNRDLRYHPLTGAIETSAGRAQFGLTFDSFGNKFVCSNREHIQYAVLQAADLARNPYLSSSTTVESIPVHGAASPVFALSEARTTAYAHAGTFTAACGISVYRGTALPEAYHENYFVCDPTGALVHRDVIEPRGAGLTARRARDEAEYLASPDNWFRPVFLTNGPDGAQYLCDMYRETIEHPVYLPKEVVEVTDFESGDDRGRIYRITGADGSIATVTGLKDTTPDALVALLSHGDGWKRDTAHRLLLDMPEALPTMQEALTITPDVRAYLHLFYLIDAHGGLNATAIAGALQHASPNIREHALRVARSHPEWLPELVGVIAACAVDDNPRVRFQCALVLGDLPEPDIAEPLARIAQRDLADSWARTAVLSSLGNGSADFAALFVKELNANREGLQPFLTDLGRQLALQHEPAVVAAFLEGFLTKKLNNLTGVYGAALTGVLDGVRRADAYSKEGGRFEALMAALPEESAARLEVPIKLLIEQSKMVAESPTTPEVKRLAAIRLLGQTDYDTAGKALADLLTPLAPGALQVAAVQGLSAMNDPRAPAALLEPTRWGAYSPPVRSAALSAMLSNGDRVELLLNALEAGDIAPWTIGAASRNRLRNQRDETRKARARALFEVPRARDRSRVYEEYRSVLTLAPEPANGRKVFQEVCASCHRFNEDGHEVGPDLSGISSQPLESILLHILVPNSLMVDGYENYLVETSNFESFSGIIVSETATTLTIRQAFGEEATVDRADVLHMEANQLSMMPEGLEEGMTRQALRDLIGYLKGEQPAN